MCACAPCAVRVQQQKSGHGGGRSIGRSGETRVGQREREREGEGGRERATYQVSALPHSSFTLETSA